MPDFFDIHSHINFSDFDRDREDVIERSLGGGVWMINIGSDFLSSRKALEIAERYDKGVYASVGLHPNDNKDEIFQMENYSQLAKNNKVVAIGECGLDLKNQKSNLKNQKDIFEEQIKLAIKLDKPLMIHCREAHEEVIKILNTYYLIHNTKLRGNIHFFSGDWEIAQKYFNLGFTISFTGVITFTRQYDEIIKKAPLEKIMIETDAPFVAPVPHRGERNEPLYVKKIAKKIAEIRKESYEKVAKVTTDNALKFFNINF
ncbi:MAG: TatD family hydrolase [Patescibacteria group bacterium]